MIKLVREFRLIPVVLIAITSLLALKVLGLVLDGGYTFSMFDAADPVATPTLAAPNSIAAAEESPPAADPAARKSWAQEMFNFPDITGSVDVPKAESAKPGEGSEPAKAVPLTPKPGPQGTVIQLDTHLPSDAERAVLERLQQRREELDARGRELDIRESLLKAAEKRVEARVAELKDVESRINAAMQQKDEVEAARFKGLVTMYENMKAKDAAKIFDRLETPTLLEVSTQINPRRMADILAQMSPDVAERLTVELAKRASMKGEQQQPQGAELPKIEGRRSGS